MPFEFHDPELRTKNRPKFQNCFGAPRRENHPLAYTQLLFKQTGKRISALRATWGSPKGKWPPKSKESASHHDLPNTHQHIPFTSGTPLERDALMDFRLSEGVFGDFLVDLGRFENHENDDFLTLKN